MAKKKSSFYHVRWHRVGVNAERAAEIIGVGVEEIRQWDKEGAPLMAERLLLLWDRKNIGAEGWEGFYFSRGVLRCKNRRWTAQTLLLWQDQAEEVERLKTRLRRFSTWRGLSTAFVDKLGDSIRRRSKPHGFEVD